MVSKIHGVKKAHPINGNYSMLVIFPHRLREELRIEKGTYLVVWADDEGRLVYERTAPYTDTDTDTDRREKREE
jgi:bifunctional DNA-binding transcriptional regulator/antitoxin component of YhaV-PrlF toxin-antitoxin module